MGREAVRRCGAEGRTHAGPAQSCSSRASAHSGHPEESAWLPACCAEWSPCHHGFRRPQRQEALALAKSRQSGMCCAVLCVGTCALQSLKPLGEHCPGHSEVAWSLLRCHTEVPGDEHLVAGRGLSGAAVGSGSHSLYICEEVAVRKASWRQQPPGRPEGDSQEARQRWGAGECTLGRGEGQGSVLQTEGSEGRGRWPERAHSQG